MIARTIELSDEIQRQVAEIARRTGRAETDVLRDAIGSYVVSRHSPAPKSDGTIDDPDLPARDIDNWLAKHWRPA